MLVRMNKVEAFDILYDITNHEHEQKSHAMKDIQQHSQNFTAVVQIFTRKRLKIYHRYIFCLRCSRAIWAGLVLARREATVNL